MKLLIALALLTLIPIAAFADVHDDIAVIDPLQAIALIAATIGATGSAYLGYRKTQGEKFDVGKFFSAWITGIMGAFAMINLGAIPTDANGGSLIGVFLAYLLMGYGVDKGLARLDRAKKKPTAQ